MGGKLAVIAHIHELLDINKGWGECGLGWDEAGVRSLFVPRVYTQSLGQAQCLSGARHLTGQALNGLCVFPLYFSEQHHIIFSGENTLC